MQALDRRDFFFCYSGNLKGFLVHRGLNYIVKANHDKTQKEFWLFQRTPDLVEALSVWSQSQ